MVKEGGADDAGKEEGDGCAAPAVGEGVAAQEGGEQEEAGEERPGEAGGEVGVEGDAEEDAGINEPTFLVRWAQAVPVTGGGEEENAGIVTDRNACRPVITPQKLTANPAAVSSASRRSNARRTQA